MMRIRRLLPVLGLASALIGSDPARAQTAGALQQASGGNPFTAMLEGRPTLSFKLNSVVENNTYSLGDLAAIIKIMDDFKPSDAFLIGGKAIPGQGVVGRSHNEGGLLFALPVPFGMVGLSAGARAHVQGSVPEAVAKILRDGSTSDDLTVSLSDLEGRGITYGQVGLLSLFDLAEDAESETRIRVGVGAHYLYSLAGGEVGFDRSAFAERSTSRVSFDNSEVEVDLDLTYPLGAGTTGGQGFAGDVFIAANVGKLYLGGLARAGKVEHMASDRGRIDWEFVAGGIGELFDVLDTLSTDTIPGIKESTTLPTTLRFEGSYQLNPSVGVGVLWEDGIGGAYDVDSSIIGVVEFRPAQWLPVRVGGNWLQGFGSGLSGGLGLDFEGFEFNLAASAQGGIGDKSQSGIVRTGFAFFF